MCAPLCWLEYPTTSWLTGTQNWCDELNKLELHSREHPMRRNSIEGSPLQVILFDYMKRDNTGGAQNKLSNDLNTKIFLHCGLGGGKDIKRYLRDFSHRFLLWENGSAEKRAWRPEVAGQSPNTKDGQRQPTDRLQRPSRSSCYGWGSLCFIHSTIKCTCQGGKLYVWVMQKRPLQFLLCCYWESCESWGLRGFHSIFSEFLRIMINNLSQS